MEDNNIDQFNDKSKDFVQVKPLLPTGPAKHLFIAGASVFEITVFTPPIQRVTILGINLPDPDTFGPYGSYIATLLIPNSSEPLSELYLEPTEDKQNWVASTFLEFGGTLPNIVVEIRPSGYDRLGDIILRGNVFP